MCYAEIRRDGTDRIHMARNRHQKRAVMNTTITAAFDKMRSICRLSDRSQLPKKCAALRSQLADCQLGSCLIKATEYANNKTKLKLPTCLTIASLRRVVDQRHTLTFCLTLTSELGGPGRLASRSVRFSHVYIVQDVGWFPELVQTNQ